MSATLSPSVPPSSGGAGLAITPATATTASIAATGNEDLDVTIGFDEGWFSATVTQTAGASTSVAVLWYADAARTTLLGSIFGSTFGGETLTTPLRGPRPNIGGTPSLFTGRFYDAEATGKLHLRVFNHDGAEAATVRVDVAALEVA